MTSILLIEAFLVGKKVVSLQPGLKGPDHLILSRRGLVPVFRERQRFDPFGFTAADPARFPVHFDTERFLQLLDEILSVQSFT